MTLRVCQDCTTAYAPDLRLCPHCGSERGVGGSEEGGDMPKIHKDREPTYAVVGDSGPEAVIPRPPTAPVAPESGQPSADLAPEPQAYADMTADQLRAELKERGLPTSGNKRDLVSRVEEHDLGEASA